MITADLGGVTHTSSEVERSRVHREISKLVDVDGRLIGPLRRQILEWYRIAVRTSFNVVCSKKPEGSAPGFLLLAWFKPA
jgi:hypothetical protein